MRSPIRFTKFHPEHLRYIVPQEIQKRSLEELIASDHVDLIAANFGISGWVGHKCIGACGAIAVHPHRAVGWALLSEDAGDHMLPIVRKVRAYVGVMAFKRLEAHVHVDFGNGHRFARLIGMKQETGPMEHHGPNGETEIQYALTR